ncbi:hypothetical protein KAR91_18455 [Candidatus Pacearchaeota archaeon]|nr:hypothetical protein [Candidatus Pacearchaeota archaeon]
MTVKVGNREKKEVSELNHTLYKQAEYILENEQHRCHIGWSGVGSFIDWLESNYELTKKDGVV